MRFRSLFVIAPTFQFRNRSWIIHDRYNLLSATRWNNERWDERETVLENSISSITCSEAKDNDDNNNNIEATSVVLQIAYDGLHFHGWTAANSDEEGSDDIEDDHPIPYLGTTVVGTPAAYGPRPKNRQHPQKQQTQRNNKNIRTVQKTLVKALAKIYGNVPLERIIVEGCSRTDRGVSAIQLVAHVYCQKEITITTATDWDREDTTNNRSWSSTGSVGTRPVSPIDPHFHKLPFDGNLKQLIYVLNRMLPFDVRVLKAAYMPFSTSSSPTSSSAAITGADTITTFHPSLTAVSKTYLYRLSIPHPGTVYDPLQWRHVWNIAPSSSSLHRQFDFQRAQQACDLFQGQFNFKAFQGALRGSDRTSIAAARKANNTICNITDISIIKEGDQKAARNYHLKFDLYGISPPEFLLKRGLVVGSTAFQTTNYVVVLRGDRFLYKMCRFLVGIIVAAGYGKVSLESIHGALQTGSWEVSSGLVDDSSIVNNNDNSSNRCENPPGSNLLPKFECAPSHGLVLYKVEYPQSLSPKWQE